MRLRCFSDDDRGARLALAIADHLADLLGTGAVDPDTDVRSLGFDSLAQLRQSLFKAYPHFQRIDEIATGSPTDIEKLAGVGGTPVKLPFISPVEDFYLSNPVARASVTMAECSAIAEGHATLTAAE